MRKKVLSKDLHYLCTLSYVENMLYQVSGRSAYPRSKYTSQAWIILVIEGKKTDEHTLVKWTRQDAKDVDDVNKL